MRHEDFCRAREPKDFPEWFPWGCFERLSRDALPAGAYYVKHLMISAQELELDSVYGFGLMKTLPYIVEPMVSRLHISESSEKTLPRSAKNKTGVSGRLEPAHYI